MPDPVKLLSIGVAVPPNIIDQSDAAVAAHEAFSARFGDFDRLVKVFDSAGIKRRYGVRPIDWYLRTSGWQERNAAYIEGAGDLFVEAARKALDAAGLSPSEVDVIVTVSSTGIATPSLDAQASGRMGFREDVLRVPVFGLGCAGGVSGFAIAANLAAARPGCIVLLVAVETCTLAFRMDKLTKANIVATALFGDGAAACVIASSSHGIAEVEMSGQHTWPDTLDIMGWSVEPEGLGVIFDRAIPPFAEAKIEPAISTILSSGDLTLAEIDRFACHPGGAKVIDALETALHLDPGRLNHERDVLSDYGNMSAPTVLFVLERLIRSGLPPRTLMTAMGPGFTASCVSLKAAA
ncbi:type III polyketide synthase [Rhizobium sp. YIM 134829]|uniref:type III polyketide synthase n=1 Tax=Rhizobium sp. YIM 134829 TaxID=3390453 RepID=UPI00397E4E04